MDVWARSCRRLQLELITCGLSCYTCSVVLIFSGACIQPPREIIWRHRTLPPESHPLWIQSPYDAWSPVKARHVFLKVMTMSSAFIVL